MKITMHQNILENLNLLIDLAPIISLLYKLSEEILIHCIFEVLVKIF